MTILPSTSKLVANQRKQMGDYNYVRFIRNVGLSFEEAYFLIFQKEPKL